MSNERPSVVAPVASSLAHSLAWPAVFPAPFTALREGWRGESMAPHSQSGRPCLRFTSCGTDKTSSLQAFSSLLLARHWLSRVQQYRSGVPSAGLSLSKRLSILSEEMHLPQVEIQLGPFSDTELGFTGEPGKQRFGCSRNLRHDNRLSAKCLDSRDLDFAEASRYCQRSLLAGNVFRSNLEGIPPGTQSRYCREFDQAPSTQRATRVIRDDRR